MFFQKEIRDETIRVNSTRKTIILGVKCVDLV